MKRNPGGKKSKMKLIVPVFILLVLVAVIPGMISQQNDGNGKSNNQNENSTDDVVYVDVNQFSRITSEELIEIMGEPKSIEEWSNSTDRGEFLIEIYDYDGYEFFVADDSVVRMNIYSDKYYNVDGEGIKFSSEESIFNMLNIPVDYDRIKKTGDTGSALRYSPVSDKVADIWCIGIEDNTIEEIKVTFNLNYF